MKKLIVLSLAVLAAVAVFQPAAAEDGKKFTLSGEIRSRLDYWDNATDLTDATDDNFSVWPYRVRIAANGTLTDNVGAYIELQNFGTFGNTWPETNGFFEDSSGSGNDVQMYQAYIDLKDIGGSGMTVRIGRQEMAYGTELLLGDLDFYNGISFDGVRAMRMADKYDFNVFYFKVFEGNNFFGTGSDDDNLFGATFDWKFDNLGSLGGYAIVAQALDIDSKINTYGVRWNKGASQDSAFDWNLEYAMQSGDFGEPAFGPGIDISANLLEGWFGYSFGDTFRNRVHIGVLSASGDDGDLTDNETEDFFVLFPDYHANGRLGLLDWFSASDIEDINIGWAGTFGDGKHMLGVAAHDFTLAEDLGGDDDLGTEIDVTYDYMPNSVLGFQVGYGQLDPGKAYDFPGFEADAVTRFWAQVRARW